MYLQVSNNQKDYSVGIFKATEEHGWVPDLEPDPDPDL
jgi:hypothetical protein